MPYATLDELIDRYGENLLINLTDRAGSGVVDADVVARALADTDAEIDGYLKLRYTLPLEATPPLIADLALRLAIWKLHVYEPDPKIRADYEDAKRTLKEIAVGTVRLDLAGVEPPGSGGAGVRVTDRERPLSEASLKGFI